MQNQSWISYFSNLVKQYGGINLAQGIPGFSPPQQLIAQLQKTASEKIHQYAPGNGNHKLRDIIFDMYNSKISDKDFSLLITNGGTEAIHLLYLSFHKNTEKLKTAAFSPVYESYLHLPRIHGDEFKSINIENNSAKQEEKIKEFFENYNPDVFFVNSPGNPHGKSIDKNCFDTLIKLSSQNNCKIIIDAVYDKLYFNSPPYYPFDLFHENVFFVNSFSKLFSITGWRIGYLFCHNSKYNKISDIHDYTGLCTPSVLQESLANFMQNDDEKDKYIENLRSILKENYKSATKLLKKAGFTYDPASGGYFIWAKLPGGITNSIDFSKKLYKNTKTAIIPGEHFGKEFSSFIRINIARDYNELNTGINNICGFSQDYKK